MGQYLHLQSLVSSRLHWFVFKNASVQSPPNARNTRNMIAKGAKHTYNCIYMICCFLLLRCFSPRAWGPCDSENTGPGHWYQDLLELPGVRSNSLSRDQTNHPNVHFLHPIFLPFHMSDNTCVSSQKEIVHSSGEPNEGIYILFLLSSSLSLLSPSLHQWHGLLFHLSNAVQAPPPPPFPPEGMDFLRVPEYCNAINTSNWLWLSFHCC